MPRSLLASGGVEATGFTTSSVSPAAGSAIQLTVFCQEATTTPVVSDTDTLTWVRLDDPTAFTSEPIQSWGAIAEGGSITVTYASSGTATGLNYMLEEITGVDATTVAEAFREFSTGVYAIKSNRAFTPGDNIPSEFLDPANECGVFNVGTQFGAYAGGTTPSLIGTTLASRSQYEPNITIDLISAVGADGESSYSITWASAPFVERALYVEMIAGSAPPGGSIEPDFDTQPVVDGLANVWRSEPATTYPLSVLQIHSGHSLTDPLFYPWPGPYVYLLSNLLGVTFENIGKSTIPGSPMYYRWEHEDELEPISARYNIDEWEILSITEGIPLPDVPLSADYLTLYATNAWTNGNGGSGAATLLWTTWTEPDGTSGPFRETLDRYEPLWEAMADAATAALPTTAPAIRLIPGHRMMARFYDDIENDLAPDGVTDITDYFRDEIHVNDLGSYAVAMMHYACIFGLSPVGLPRDLWGPNQGWGPSPDTPGTPTIPTEAQALYVQETVWDIVTTYARTGISNPTVIYPDFDTLPVTDFGVRLRGPVSPPASSGTPNPSIRIGVHL